MGLHRHFRLSARFALPLLLFTIAALLLVAAALGPPASAKDFSRVTTENGVSTSMSWSGEQIPLFRAPTVAPGQRMPSIDADLIACRIGSPSDPNGFDIRYRFQDGSRGTWGGSGAQTQPCVSQGLIAGLDNGVVAVFDPSKGTAVPVSDQAAVPTAPAFAGDLVVWQDKRSGGWDIYGRRFDRATGQPQGDVFAICTATGDQTYPAVDGGIVVWQDRRGGDWDLYSYDVTAALESQIAAAPGDQSHPDISGSVVVWQDSRRGNWDIYACDLATKDTWPISLQRGAQTWPAVSNEMVVWEDREPRVVEYETGGPVLYTDPNVGGYSLAAKDGLYDVAFDREGTWQTRPDVSGWLTVAEDQQGPRALGITRVTGWLTSDLWAYAFNVVAPEDYWWTNASEITFSLDVIVCPHPPVAQMSLTIDPFQEYWWDPAFVWEPFAATKTIALDTMAEGEKMYTLSLKDSAGETPGSEGSSFTLDRHGPSCWAPGAVTVTAGSTASLPFKVTDALSPEAKVTIAIKRADGSVVTTLKPRWVKTGRLLTRPYFADLIPATYTFEVTATDMAGNAQVRIGSNTLTVR